MRNCLLPLHDCVSCVALPELPGQQNGDSEKLCSPSVSEAIRLTSSYGYVTATLTRSP